MLEMTEEQLQQPTYILFIHTPLCGTCNMARSMLSKMETVHKKDMFYSLNASLFPNFMQEAQVESVPCLLMKQDGIIQDKMYAFHSIPNIYHHLLKHQPNVVTA